MSRLKFFGLLENVVERLVRKKPFQNKNKDYVLSRDWAGHRE